jgi:hypothetical protein
MARRRVVFGLHVVAFLAMLTLIAISPRPGSGWINPRHEVLVDAIALTREHVMDGLYAVAILSWLIAGGVWLRSWSRRGPPARE